MSNDPARPGTPRPRREDARLVTGQGAFIDDIAAPDALHITFVRAESGPAMIVSLETARAKAHPGVIAVLTAQDIAGLGEIAVNPMLSGANMPPQPLLPLERVEAPGQLLAAVIATSATAARDAAELVSARLARISAGPDLPVVTHVLRNGDIDAAFRDAEHIVEAAITYAHLAPMPIEPRAALAMPDAATGRLTCWLNLQTPHRAKQELARILARDPDTIRVIAPDIGGAFGGKASITPEDVLVAFAACKFGRAMRWTATRSDEFLSAPMGRGAVMRGQLALAADGQILGLKSEGHFPLGAWLNFSALAPARNGLRMVSGPYRFRTIEARVACGKTPTAPVSIYRGAGRPEAVMLMERLMDEAAALLGMDRMALRRRNIIRRNAFPFRMGTGVSIDSGNLEGLIERLDAGIGLADCAKAIARRRRKGEIVGSGFALCVEPCGQGFETVRLTLHEDGRFTLATGASAQGQGRETTFAEIAADVLGIAPEQIRVIEGDTDAIADGLGALASRSTAIGGSAVLRVAEEAVLQARGTLGNEAPIDWVGYARQTGGFTLDARFETAEETWSSGLAYAEMAIDRDTGLPRIERLVLVDDAGVIINPLLVEGQLLGGIAQGVGEAMMERMLWSREGQLLTGSLMDYAVPRADDMPPVRLASLHTPATRNPLGAKGVGEAGTIGPPAAILNAAIDALRPLGITTLDMPLTSERLWRAIHKPGEGA